MPLPVAAGALVALLVIFVVLGMRSFERKAVG